jgi:hypothetical protein
VDHGVRYPARIRLSKTDRVTGSQGSVHPDMTFVVGATGPCGVFEAWVSRYAVVARVHARTAKGEISHVAVTLRIDPAAQTHYVPGS